MKQQNRTTVATRPDSAGRQVPSAHRLPRAFLLEPQNADSARPSNDNALAADNHCAVVIAVVKDPAQLLRDRGLSFHGDVIDLLTDLIVEAMENDS
jgi:hypothetical protein